MNGGELAIAFIAGGLGFTLADFADRYFATYDPSATGELPKDKFTGGNGTMANTLNIAAPPGFLRIGVGVALTALPGVGAYLVKNSMAKAALHGMMIGAGIKLFSTLFNAFVMGNLLKPGPQDDPKKSLGARLYPAEITAAQNMSNSPATMASPFNPGLAARPQQRDVGPFALAQDPSAFAPAPSAPPVNVAPSPPPVNVDRPPSNGGGPPVVMSPPMGPPPSSGPPARSGGSCPACKGESGACGCLGSQPQAQTNYAYLGVINES